MCRLCAITDTGHNDKKMQWLDRIFLLSQLDGLQNDGFGITNGTKIRKTCADYGSVTPEYLVDPDFIHAPIVAAHLRKASAATGRTDKESHPYRFPVDDRYIICAHNGYISGTGTHDHKSDVPDTDSWRAFANLAGIIQRNGVLNGATIEEWLESYLSASTLAIFLMWEGALYMFRHAKPLHIADLGNGYIIHTSMETLQKIRPYIKITSDVDMGTITLLPENTLLKLENNTITSEEVKVHFQQSQFRSYETYPTTQTGQKKEETTAIVVTARPPVQNQQPLAKTREIWRHLQTASNPMRNLLFLQWFFTTQKVPLPTEVVTIAEHVKYAPIEQLTMFMSMVAPWSARQRQLLDAWNKVIEAGHDMSVHRAIFGERWFWCDPSYISESRSDKDALDAFIEDVCLGIASNDLFAQSKISKNRILAAVMEGTEAY